MGLRPLQMDSSISVGIDFRRQIMTSKVNEQDLQLCYVMGLRPLQMDSSISVGIDFRRQIMTSKVNEQDLQYYGMLWVYGHYRWIVLSVWGSTLDVRS